MAMIDDVAMIMVMVMAMVVIWMTMALIMMIMDDDGEDDDEPCGITAVPPNCHPRCACNSDDIHATAQAELVRRCDQFVHHDA